MLEPIVHELADDWGDNVKVVKLQNALKRFVGDIGRSVESAKKWVTGLEQSKKNRTFDLSKR